MPKTAQSATRKKRPTKTTTKKKTTKAPNRVRKSTPRSPAKSGQPQLANYTEATRWLNDRVDFERARTSRLEKSVFKLDRIRRITDALGNPQDAIQSVHIAGTNGKGSIIAMLSHCLEECGYAVGSYTSPHLVDVRERIAINGTMVTHHRFTDLMNRVAQASSGLPQRLGEPTYFEVLTAAALLHFAEQAVDLALVEVGLGGRLDSTNIIKPIIAAVGGVALDHMSILGETPEVIAREKAGIFKPEAACLTFAQDKKVIAAMREVAQEANATLQVVGDNIDYSFRFEVSPQLGPHMRVGLSTAQSSFEHVPVPLPGEHQAKNCGLMLAILDKLSERGFVLPEAKVITGLEKTVIAGRMELAWPRPRVMLDGAHNPAALGALVKSLGANVPYDSLIVIFGCSADKDVDGLLGQLITGADKVIFTKSKSNPRAADPKDLAKRFTEMSGKMCQETGSLDEALSTAARAVGRDDLICVTGSFFLAGEAKKHLADKQQKMASK